MKVILFLVMLVGAVMFFFDSDKSLEQIEKSSKENQSSVHKDVHSLIVKVSPTDARVYITNIKPKYYDGIKLKKGFYKIKVIKKGYISKNKNIQLTDNLTLNIILEKQKKLKKPIKHGIEWKDIQNNLIWQLEISKKTYNWMDAKKYCHNLKFAGYTNWKLPNKKELSSLMTSKSCENSKSNLGKTYIKKPLLKTMNMKWQTFWCATEQEKDSPNAWNIYFDYGSGEYYDKSNENYVRCVLKK